MFLSLEDVIIAGLFALVLTWVINSLSKVIKVVVNYSTELGYNHKDTDAIVDRCYFLFPIESLMFKGATVRRGMYVRATTSRNKTIEGKFLGINNENIVCFLTENKIIAHELKGIEQMVIL